MTEKEHSKSHKHETKDNDKKTEHKHDTKKHTEHDTKKHTEHKTKAKKSSGLDMWHIATIILGVILIASFLTNGFGMWSDSDTKVDDVKDDSTQVDTDSTSFKMYMLNDNRCDSCQGQEQQLTGNLKRIFPDITIEKIEYTTKAGEEFYNKYNLKFLPALVFEKDVEKDPNYNQISQFVSEVDGLYVLTIQGITHDPNMEICSNGIDDNENGLVDCADSSCAGSWECMEKKEVPEVELFIMSHCPYGTQMEKGILPVVELLGDKVDFKLKFVNYAMHAEKEVDEQLNQYCIDKEQNDKLLPYLRCFLTAGDGKQCLIDTKIDIAKMESCLVDTEKEFGVKSDYADKTTWKGNFASFNIHNADNIKYGVRGSPHLIVNGVKPEAGRDSVSLLKAVCTAFENKPEECNTVLKAGSPSPGFGWTETQAAANTGATCG